MYIYLCILYFLLENHSHGKTLLDSATRRLGNTDKIVLQNGNLQRGIS